MDGIFLFNKQMKQSKQKEIVSTYLFHPLLMVSRYKQKLIISKYCIQKLTRWNQILQCIYFMTKWSMFLVFTNYKATTIHYNCVSVFENY